MHRHEIVIEAETTIARRGRTQRLVIATATDTAAKPEPSLVQALVRAQRWFKMLVDHKVESIADLARLEGVNRGWISNQIALAFLAPDIVRSILAGSQPVSLTLDRMIEISTLSDWSEQVAGFARA